MHESHDGHIHHGNEDWYAEYVIYPYADVEDSCQISFVNDDFKQLLYAFDFEGFDPVEISKSFSEHAKMDSITLEDVPGYSYHLFRYSDSISRFDFLVKSFDSTEYFFIDRAQLSSNLVDFKNGLTMGISKSEFRQVMRLRQAICDTFRVSDGELASDYDFIFVNDSLDKILIWAAH